MFSQMNKKFFSIGRDEWGLSEDDGCRIELAQLEMRAKLVPMMVTTGSMVAISLFFSTYHDLPKNTLYLPFLAIILSYSTLVLVARMWRRAAKAKAVVRRYKRIFCSLQFAIGSSWAWLMAVGLPAATPDERCVFYALAIGLMSAPAFYGPAEYALALWAPVTTGAAAALALSSGNLPLLPTFTGLLGYAALTFTTILRIDRHSKANERQRLEAERQSETIGMLMREFQEDASDWLWETDSDLRIVRPSERFAAAAEEPPAALAGRSLLELVVERPGLRPLIEDAAPPEGLAAHVARRGAFRDVRVPVRVHGKERWWLLSGKPTLDSQRRFCGYRGVGSDITGPYRAEQEIRFLATHDPLTKLGNRASFDVALDHICSSPTRTDHALLCLDLDHFKQVNDQHGHKMGDAVLVAAAQRMRACIRPQDSLFRLGGDEFAVLLSPADRDEAALVARRVITRLTAPFVVGGVTSSIGACVGIGMLDEHRCTAAAVHHQADLALYTAKAAGRGAVRFAVENSAGLVVRSGNLAADLLEVLDDADICVEYQPIVDLESGRIRSFEALVRWRHPIHGLLYPDEFIALAEANGAISRIGWVVIERAFAELRRLPDAISIAINISPSQLNDVDLTAKIEMLLNKSHIDPKRIYFEITEKLQIERRHTVDSFFAKMSLIGCRISLDDFGSGYSSIRSLFDFRFDKIKIDRALFSEASSDTRKLEVLLGVRDLARRIGVALTVEGIETAREADFLRDAGFQEGQGYYFGRPKPSASLLEEVAEVGTHLV